MKAPFAIATLGLVLALASAGASASPLHVVNDPAPFGPDHPDFRPMAATPLVRGEKLAPGERPARTTISNIIYINNCMPNGCNVRPGGDDSRSNTSSIAQRPVTLGAFPWGDAAWKNVVRCMQDTYSPFGIKIVTQDPGNAAHSEVMFGGKSTDFDPSFSAGGVAPYLSCGATEENGLSFVFAAQTSSLDFLCWAGVQESSHIFGLDHELNAKDPLTYLFPPYHKEFQDADADCGEVAGQPRECFCGGAKQNSYRYMLDVFGPGTPEPPSIAIVRPKPNSWVVPEFAIEAEVNGRFSVETVAARVGESTAGSLSQGPYVFSAPASLAPGAQTVKVTATSGASSLNASVEVKVLATCANGAGCSDGFLCLHDICLPDAKEPGGLGATCTINADCLLGTCASDGSNKYCTATCDTDRVCPNGFSCLDASATQTFCWPASASGGGGCQTGGGSGSVAALALGLLGSIVVLRRRSTRVG
jgi:MYXO-CTERM domain-containing protein